MFHPAIFLLTTLTFLGPAPDRDGWHKVNGVWMQPSARMTWNEMLAFRWDGGNLIAEALPDDRAKQLFTAGRRAAVEVGRGKDLYEMSAMPMRTFDPTGRGAGTNGTGGSVLVARLMPEAGDEAARPMLRPMNIVAGGGVLRITGRGQVRGVGDVVVSLFCDLQTGAHLSVSDSGATDPAKNLSLRAETLRVLIQQNPRQARTFLAPLLDRLSDVDLLGAGPGDVFLAFRQIEPTPKAVAALREVLPRLIADTIEDREKAARDLSALGAAGVNAAARIDLATLHPQQQQMIESLLRDNCRLLIYPPTPEEIAALRSDEPFLADCLESSDERVRAAAIEELRESIKSSNIEACRKLADTLRERAVRQADGK